MTTSNTDAPDDLESKRTHFLREGALIGFAAVAVFLLISLLSYSTGDPGWSRTGVNNEIQNAAGPTGAWISDVLFYLFGRLAYLFPLLIAYRVIKIFRDHRISVEAESAQLFGLRILGFVLIMITGSALVYMGGNTSPDLPQGQGGLLGGAVAELLVSALGIVGSRLLLVALFLFSISLFTGISWLALFDSVGSRTLTAFLATKLWIRNRLDARAEKREADKILQKREIAVVEENQRREIRKPVEIKPLEPRPQT